MDNWLLIARERDKELLCLHRICGDLGFLHQLRFNKLQVEKRRKAYERRAADFQRLFKVRRRAKVSPGDFVPKRDDGENQ